MLDPSPHTQLDITLSASLSDVFTWFLTRAEAEGMELRIHALHVVSVDETNTFFMPDVDTLGNRRETDGSLMKNIGGNVDKKTKR